MMSSSKASLAAYRNARVRKNGLRLPSAFLMVLGRSSGARLTHSPPCINSLVCSVFMMLSLYLKFAGCRRAPRGVTVGRTWYAPNSADRRWCQTLGHRLCRLFDQFCSHVWMRDKGDVAGCNLAGGRAHALGIEALQVRVEGVVLSG